MYLCLNINTKWMYILFLYFVVNEIIFIFISLVSHCPDISLIIISSGDRTNMSRTESKK